MVKQYIEVEAHFGPQPQCIDYLMLFGYTKASSTRNPKCRARIQNSGVRSQNSCVRFADEFDFLVFLFALRVHKWTIMR